jgi:hypothetical protein
MEERPFNDMNNKPAGDMLRQTLACVYSYYNNLSAFTGEYKHDWSFSKSSGWVEKVHDAKRALFYLIPLRGVFKISLAIRESEKEAMIMNKELQKYHSLVKEARQYSEGYKLQFIIEGEDSYNFFKYFITRLMALR